MPHVVYIGPLRPEVVVVEDDGTLLRVEAGQPVDVPDTLASQLLAQPANWQVAGEPPGSEDAREEEAQPDTPEVDEPAAETQPPTGRRRKGGES